MDPARELFPKAPLHIFSRHQTVLPSIDFLRFSGKKKIDQQGRSMCVGRVLCEPDAARVFDEQRSGIA
jgi:hypothetical protein